MYRALYRKYRPQGFDSVVGQNTIVRTLQNSVINKSFSHAYMFFGPRGVGKTTASKIFARAINCSEPVDGNGSKEPESHGENSTYGAQNNPREADELWHFCCGGELLHRKTHGRGHAPLPCAAAFCHHGRAYADRRLWQRGAGIRSA